MTMTSAHNTCQQTVQQDSAAGMHALCPSGTYSTTSCLFVMPTAAYLPCANGTISTANASSASTGWNQGTYSFNSLNRTSTHARHSRHCVWCQLFSNLYSHESVCGAYQLQFSRSLEHRLSPLKLLSLRSRPLCNGLSTCSACNAVQWACLTVRPVLLERTAQDLNRVRVGPAACVK